MVTTIGITGKSVQGIVSRDVNRRYFNLITRADPSHPMLESRMLEGTPEEIAGLFKRSDKYDLASLSELPTVMTAEFEDDDNSAIAILGYIDAPSLNPTISHPVMRMRSQALFSKGLLGKWGGKRTRWMVMEGDLFRLFADCAIEGPREDGQVVDSSLAAVMMPFKTEAAIDVVYKAISEGAEIAGFHCKRADELLTPTDITDDIRDLICESGVVIVDISGKNPNVMFELGYSLGKDKSVVLVSSDDLKDLSFDIRQRRVIRYSEDEYGLKGLTEKLSKMLKSLADC